jgi:integrase/recombinase XerD
VPAYSPHCFRCFLAVTHLWHDGDVLNLQKLLGHTSLQMARLYAELSGEDVVRKHRAASPGDAFLPALRQREGRRRLR